MRLVLPLRAAGSARSSTAGGAVASAAPLPAVRSDPQRSELHGRLTANGAPVGRADRHRALQAAHRRRIRARSPRCARARTAASRFNAGSGPSRTLRFHWEGTDTARPSSADIAVLVPARSSIACRPARRAKRRGRHLQRPAARATPARGRQAGRPAGEAARPLADVRGAAGRLRRALELRLPLRGHARPASSTASARASGARLPIPTSWATPASCA